MRFLLLLCLPLMACVLPRPSAINDMLVVDPDLPPPGTKGEVLQNWFADEGYVPGPKVRQSRAELLRRPGDPLVYATEAERRWWLSQQQTSHDLCVTAKYVYYRVQPDGTLIDAIPAVRSTC